VQARQRGLSSRLEIDHAEDFLILLITVLGQVRRGDDDPDEPRPEEQAHLRVKQGRWGHGVTRNDGQRVELAGLPASWRRSGQGAVAPHVQGRQVVEDFVKAIQVERVDVKKQGLPHLGEHGVDGGGIRVAGGGADVVVDGTAQRGRVTAASASSTVSK
jgi:hypothetical protein